MHHFGALNFAAPWALPFQTQNTNQYSKIHVKLFWFHPYIKKAKKTKEKSLLPLLCTVISAKGLGSPPGLHTPDSSEIHPLSPCSGTACSSPKPHHTLSLTQTGTPDVPLLAPGQQLPTDLPAHRDFPCKKKEQTFTWQTFPRILPEDGIYVAKPLPTKKIQERTSTSRENLKASSWFLIPFYFPVMFLCSEQVFFWLSSLPLETSFSPRMCHLSSSSILFIGTISPKPKWSNF